MQDLEGRTALVTGGGNGIGQGLCRSLAAAGMRIVVADIERAAGDETAAELRGSGAEALAVETDVRSLESLEGAVSCALSTFGRLDLVCNNAGVGLEGPIETWTAAGWAWVLGVNLMGVVNGVMASAAVLKANPAGGHILNTASIGGLTAAAHHGQYAASKFAVVGLSQSLRDELAPHNVGVSVLCPGFVKSRIALSARNADEALRSRQDWLMREGFKGPAADLFRTIEARTRTGLDPSEVGAMALEAIRQNAFYVLTETEFLGELERRRRALDKGIAAVRARETGGHG